MGCPICGTEVESIMHVLWECPAANDIWGQDESGIKKWDRSEKDFLSMWGKLMNRMPKNLLEEVVVLFRKVWLRKNDWLFERRKACPRKEIISTRVALQEFKDLQGNNSKQVAVQSSLTGSLQWGKPASDYVKVNWDASTDFKQHRMGIWIMIRDEHGEALVVVCDRRENVMDAAVAECVALRKAVELCIALNIQKAIFEGDAKVVVKAVQEAEEDLPLFSPIVEDIRVYFRNNPEWSIQFVSRKKNTVAHTLAKKALTIEE
ncbi:uncharacterized protein LOC122289215 [Carya illinoinensis]|uniref:uncharacterized protein LOC122289215 n=1 Tax=Carya illinoinensis TaxID=32201 RepID=UPI001C71D456|nr:uncharacterized protein LOC122289215 [Carya illinoinensis]